ncbi:hypothetical protein D6779_09665, partial [Candidatus Parcubacteria bacterium]
MKNSPFFLVSFGLFGLVRASFFCLDSWSTIMKAFTIDNVYNIITLQPGINDDFDVYIMDSEEYRKYCMI